MSIALDSSGLSRAQMRAALLSRQDGRCALCGTGGRLAADHDHDTGLLRGLLCRSDNVREGFVKRSGLRAPDIRDYLADPPAGREWMWDFPDRWCMTCTSEVRGSGITVLEYVRSGRFAAHVDGCPYCITEDEWIKRSVALARARQWDPGD